MVTNSQYDIEDIPPAEASIDMYQQARQAVEDVPDKAQGLIEQAGNLLGELYNAAEARGDQNAMMAISGVWDRSQGLVQHLVQQHQVIAGADVAIEELKKQREAIAYELRDLLVAIEEVDTDHPKLAEFAEAIEEWSSESMWGMAEDAVFDTLYSEIYDGVRKLMKDVDPQANVYKRTDWLLGMLRGEHHMTDEQRNLLVALMNTMGN